MTEATSSTLPDPPNARQNIHTVAILFSGGPAPAANAVISTAAASFLRNHIDVLGILHGYAQLLEHGDGKIIEGRDYIRINHRRLKRTRNTQGVMIGTARANPGVHISHPDHLADPARTAPLKTVYDALCSLNVDALISIGGDDTLKTANKLKRYQDHLPEGSRRIPVVHIPKTIDNDYKGIDFTFGYFTAVETLASEIRNLLADAESNRSYFLAETMGRSAGWLAYGAGIAGEASLTFSIEDVTDKFQQEERIEHIETGEITSRRIMNVDAVVRRIVATMRVREQVENKPYGVVVLAEGLAEYLPYQYVKGVSRDEHGHIAISKINLGQVFARLVVEEYRQQTGQARRVTPVQLGYESRCARPHAFDVMLGSQLGVGAYRALVEKGLDGVMVSVAGQLDLRYVPFDELIDPESLATMVRHIKPGSDFHRLARFLETYIHD